MVLLNKTGKITLAYNKTNIVLPFEIKDDFKSLKINFKYSPKTLEDKAKEITLNVHSVSCDVDYKITVEGEEK